MDYDYIKKFNDTNDQPAVLILESPNGHIERQSGYRWNLEQFIDDDGYFTDNNGFKWKATIEEGWC